MRSRTVSTAMLRFAPSHSNPRACGGSRTARVARGWQGRGRRGVVGRSVRVDDGAEQVFIAGREMSKDTRQKQLLKQRVLDDDNH